MRRLSSLHRKYSYCMLFLQNPGFDRNSFHPGYLTAERLAKAKKLKLAVTAGIGSDHVDLNAANTTNGGITVAEVTGSNVVSVAERTPSHPASSSQT